MFAYLIRRVCGGFVTINLRAAVVFWHATVDPRPNCDYTTDGSYIEPFEFGSQTLSCEKVALICASLSTPPKGYPGAMLGKGC